MTPAAITGLGAVTCVGVGVESLWQSACASTSGIVDGLGLIDHPNPQKALSLSLLAIREAFDLAGWTGLGSRDGLILATTTGQVNLWEDELMRYASDSSRLVILSRVLRKQALGSLLEDLTKELDIRGPSLLVSSACSASTQALGLAMLWLDQGKVDRCLVGGVETLSHLTREGFRSLQLLNSSIAKPFDQYRQGINLSEAAAFLCLERAPSTCFARLTGFGLTSDSHHLTAPHPEGRGSYRAMKSALSMAGLEPQQIDWVHAHGTGSQANDLAEGIALNSLFGSEQPYASSTKGIHGHALGATGAVETILCIKALQSQLILPTFGLTSPDDKIRLRHPDGLTSHPLRHVLKNTLGFGGSNAALVVSLGDAP